MNDAFGAVNPVKPAASEKKKSKKKKVGFENQLNPILEEGSTAVVPYKPDASLADQRKAKNEALKKKVQMIVEMEKAETSSISSKMSDVSQVSEKNMFITATKTKKEKIDNTEAAI